jgi:hypothetical protein
MVEFLYVIESNGLASECGETVLYRTASLAVINDFL